ncbi:MAG TPA: hypothetical protein VH478_25870 [Trebonia sp.]|jgi:hypothetical protein|nr:hypothetical protein [Trebonia sp.]
MSTGSVTSLVIGIAVLVLLVVRQLQTRTLRENYRISVILGIIGLVEFVRFLGTSTARHNESKIVIAVVGSLVLAAVLGAVRALTVRVWRDPGGPLLRKGTWLTALLWVVALGVHLGYDYLVIGGGKDGDATGNATILLYLVISLTIQRFVLLTRVSRMESRGQFGRGPRGPVTGRAGY